MADPDLQTVLDEASLFLQARRYDDAHETLVQGLARWPGDASILTLMAHVKEVRSGPPRATPRAFPQEEPGVKPGSSRLALYGGLVLVSFLALFLLCGRGEEKNVLAAFDAYQRAMASRDLRALKKSLTQSRLREMEGSVENPDDAAELAFALSPAEVQVVETHVEEGRADLQVKGRWEETGVTGSVRLLKEGSDWKVDLVRWNLGPGGAAGSSAEESSESAAEYASEPAPTREGETRTGSEEAAAPLSPGGAAELDEAGLLETLRWNDFPATAFRELDRRGKKARALGVLQERLRAKSEKRGESNSTVVQLLSEAGQPVLFDWRKEDSPKLENEGIDLLEWEVEVRAGTLYSSGTVYLGRGLVEGYGKKPESGSMSLTPGSEIEFTLIRGDTELSKKELKLESRAGDNSWSQLPLSENIGPGTYAVRPFLHAQFTGSDGLPKSLNYTELTLKIEVR